MSESDFATLSARLARIEDRIESLHAAFTSERTVKDFYTAAEVAELVDRSAFQVREWLKTGRMTGVRAASGRGRHAEWRVSHAELEHYRNHGLRAAASV